MPGWMAGVLIILGWALVVLGVGFRVGWVEAMVLVGVTLLWVGWGVKRNDEPKA